MITTDTGHVIDLHGPGQACAMHEIKRLPVAMRRVEVGRASLVQHLGSHAPLGRSAKNQYHLSPVLNMWVKCLL